MNKMNKLPGYLLYSLFILIIITVFYLARKTLVLFIIGTGIAYILYPLVKQVEKILIRIKIPQRFRRASAIFIVYILFFYAVALLFVAFGDLIVTQTKQLINQLNLKDTLIPVIYDFLQEVNLSNPEEVGAFLKQFWDNFGTTLQQAFHTASAGTWNIVSTTFKIIINIVVLPFWMFYLMYQPRVLLNGIMQLLPKSARGDITSLAILSNRVLNNYVRGQLLLCLIVGSMTYIGLLILKIPNPFPLAVLAGIFEAIPNLGPIVSAIPSIFVASTMGWKMMLAVAILYTIIQQLENNFLVPKVQGATMSLPPVAVLLLVVIGGALMGLLGMILIIPIAAVLKDVFHYLFIRLNDTDLKPEEIRKKVKNEPLSVDML